MSDSEKIDAGQMMEAAEKIINYLAVKFTEFRARLSGCRAGGVELSQEQMSSMEKDFFRNAFGKAGIVHWLTYGEINDVKSFASRFEQLKSKLRDDKEIGAEITRQSLLGLANECFAIAKFEITGLDEAHKELRKEMLDATSR